MLGEKLSLLRKNNKLTQLELAKTLGISRQAYNNYENNRREPDYQLVNVFASYFNVSVDYLLGRDDEPKKIHPSETDERILELTSQNKAAGQLFDLFPQLSPEQQKTILDLAQVYIAQQAQGNRE